MRRLVSSDRIAIDDAFADRPLGFTASARIEARRIVVPRAVRICDGSLEWSPEEPGWDHRRSLAFYAEAELDPWKLSDTDDKLLPSFVQLFKAPDDDIKAFAQRYGVLYLDERGVPGCELEVVEYPDETVTETRLRKVSKGVAIDSAGRVRPVRWYQEPLVLWRDWSLLVRLLLLYGIKLRDAETRVDCIQLLNEWKTEVPPYVDDKNRWYLSEPRFVVSSLSYIRDRDSGEDRLTTLGEQRAELGAWLDMLSNHSQAAVQVSWVANSRPEIRIGRSRAASTKWLGGDPNNVFGDIFSQLLATLSGERNIHICPACATPYPCIRRRGYCPACRSERRRATRRATWHSHPEYSVRRRQSVVRSPTEVHQPDMDRLP